MSRPSDRPLHRAEDLRQRASLVSRAGGWAAARWGAAWIACAASGAAQDVEAASVPKRAAELSGGGATFMVLSLLFVWVLTLWCFKRVLTTPNATDPGPAGKP